MIFCKRINWLKQSDIAYTWNTFTRRLKRKSIEDTFAEVDSKCFFFIYVAYVPKEFVQQLSHNVVHCLSIISPKLEHTATIHTRFVDSRTG